MQISLVSLPLPQFTNVNHPLEYEKKSHSEKEMTHFNRIEWNFPEVVRLGAPAPFHK